MTTDWDPKKYKDQYQTALMELIEEKAKKHQPGSKQPPRPVATNVIDFVAVLQESLKKASSRMKAGGSGKTKSPPKSKKRSSAA